MPITVYIFTKVIKLFSGSKEEVSARGASLKPSSNMAGAKNVKVVSFKVRPVKEEMRGEVSASSKVTNLCNK